MVNKIKPVPYVLMVGGLSQTEHNWIQEDFVPKAGTWSIAVSVSEGTDFGQKKNLNQWVYWFMV